MDPQVEKLTKHILGLQSQIDHLHNTASQNDVLLTTEENARVDSLQAEIENTTKEIENRQKTLAQQARLRTSIGRQTDDQPTTATGPAAALSPDGDGSGLRTQPTPPRKPGSLPAELKDGKCGFKNVGEYFLAVRANAGPGSKPDSRLHNLAPTSYANEGTGADGGFAVPPDFRKDIMTRVYDDGALIEQCEQLTTTSNSLTLPMDETYPWDGSGVQVYWDGEAAQIQQSKPVLTDKTWKMNRLTALVPITDELLEDAPSMAAFITRNVPQRMRYQLNEVILFGNGVGKPQGALTSNVVVRVAAESAQPTATLMFENITKMWSRMDASSRRRAAWVYSQDIEPQLTGMKFPNGSGATLPVFLPPGALSTTPYATLYGRPMIPLENCPTIGVSGDISLLDLSKYGILTKNGSAIKQDVSMHVMFEYNMQAFRFVMRVGGQPFWTKPKTRAKSSTTLSCFVTLADRP